MTPTLDQLTSEHITVICDDWWNSILKAPVYQARLYIAGEPTSVRCHHNHKTPEATAKCQHRLFQEVTGNLATAFAVEQHPDGLLDIHYIGPDAYGNEVPRYIRFRWHDPKEDQ